MRAIVYESNTGFTEQYARLLEKKIHLPCYPVDQAEHALQKGEYIIFLTWVEDGKLQKWKEVNKHYDVGAICAVGMRKPTEETRLQLRKDNKIKDTVPLYQLVGGVHPEMMIGREGKKIAKLAKELEKNGLNTAEDEAILDVLLKGGNLVDVDRLADMIDYYYQQY